MRAHVGHFEIPARRPRRAAEFFRAAFGWQVEPLAWEGGEYQRIRVPQGGGSVDDGVCGGLVEHGALGIESPLPVVHVDGAELEAALAAIERAGGERLGETVEVAGRGRFARFRDTEGNAWGLWAGETGDGAS